MEPIALAVESQMSSSSEALHDKELERAAVRKFDYFILPTMTMFYLLSFLDRANIGNARVAGLQKDLHMTDHQYQICVTVLFVPYIAAELPANLLLRKVGPNIMLPALLTLWGIILTVQGTVTSFEGLATTRAFLGLVEGPMFPGLVLYLSGFYTREELSLRVALFFSSASLSGAFSGLLAAAIQNMHGVGGKPGWAWIFILEGLFSVVIGITGFFIVPLTPRDLKFLTDEEKDIIQQRVERDRPLITGDEFTLKEIFRSLTSPHVVMVIIIFFVDGTILFGLALFTPSIVNQLGFAPTRTQLLSVGPFATGFFVTLISAYLSDRYKARAFPIAMIAMLTVIGCAIFLSSAAENKYVAYGSLYLTIPGVYAITPILSAWMANNSEPHYRRATSIALGFIAGNAGGILSTWSFPTKEGPRFKKTSIMNLVLAIVMVIGPLANAIILTRMNTSKQRRRNEILAPYLDEKNPDGGARAWTELGDKHPDFRYTI